MFVFAYVHPDGHLQVSIHLEDTADWLQRPDATVPLRVSVGPHDVFTG